MYARYKRAGYVEAVLEAAKVFEKKHGHTVKSKAAEGPVKPGVHWQVMLLRRLPRLVNICRRAHVCECGEI